MMKLIEALEYVRAYIDDLLVITRGTLEDHLEKLREVLRRLRGAGLTINAAKSLFCTHEGTGDTRVKTITQCEGATPFPWHGTVLLRHVGEACEMLAQLSYQESAEKRKPPGKTRSKETLALGFNSSNNICQ